MSTHIIPLQKLPHCFHVPQYTHPNDAGMDVYAAENVVIRPGERTLVGTGVKVKLPENKELEVVSRSGLAIKHGIIVLNSPGTIDPDYSDEIKIIVANLGHEVYNIQKGDRIAQMKLRHIDKIVWDRVASIGSSEHRSGGFGSSGYGSETEGC